MSDSTTFLSHGLLRRCLHIRLCSRRCTTDKRIILRHLLPFKMKSCTLIVTACLLPAILAVSVEKANENEALLHRIVEKNVPSSYEKAYNILMKANELEARSRNTNEAVEKERDEHFPGDGHDHDDDDDVVTNASNHRGSSKDVNASLHHVANSGNVVPPPIDPQIKLEVSEILANTIEDVNDRLFSLAENIRILSKNQLLLNARLSAVEMSVGEAPIPAVIGIHDQNQPLTIGIHDQNQPLTDQANPQDLNQEDNPTTAQPTQQDEGDDSGGLQGNTGIIHQLLNVTEDNIEDTVDIVEAESGVRTEGAITQVGQETTMPPHTSANVKGDQKQPTTVPPHTNGDSQQPSAADVGVVIKEKQDLLGDHRQYSFRGYNPFVGDRRGDVLGRLRDGLPYRQVPSQVPVLPRQRPRLDQMWYKKRYGNEN